MQVSALARTCKPVCMLDKQAGSLSPTPFLSGSEDDTIGDLKKLVAAQTGTRPDKIRIQKWYTIYKDHITLEDYEIHDGMGLELYYN